MRNDNMPKPWPPAEPCMTSAVEVLRDELANMERHGEDKHSKRFREALARIERLVEADVEYNAAKIELAAAERERGNFNVNPLPHTHPAILRMGQARAKRREALADVLGEEG